MYALNFYSPIVADQLRSRRKTATIRLGDKSNKYKKGMVVQVLVGQRYGPREKIFDAVIDKVEVKRLMELSPREIEHDNPEIRRPEDMASFLGQLYNRNVTEDDVVTLIRFSEISGTYGARLRHETRQVTQCYLRPGFRIGPPNASAGRNAAPQASQSTANAEEKRASHSGQRARISPPHAGHAAESCPSDSSK